MSNPIRAVNERTSHLGSKAESMPGGAAPADDDDELCRCVDGASFREEPSAPPSRVPFDKSPFVEMNQEPSSALIMDDEEKSALVGVERASFGEGHTSNSPSPLSKRHQL